MEDKIKKELGTATLKSAGHSEGGCISQGQSYHTDTGKVFVKINHKSQVTMILLLTLLMHFVTWHFFNPSQAKSMFDGEMASLDAIIKTGTIKVPKPVKVIELDSGGCVFVMEHLDMRGLNK